MKIERAIASLCFAGSILALVSPAVLAQAVTVTGIEVIGKDSGAELVVQTADGSQPQSFLSKRGNSFIIDIPNAQLNIFGKNYYQVANPVMGIREVSAANADGNSVRVMVTGNDRLPGVKQVVREGSGLIFNVSPSGEIAQQPKEQEIDITVTATRTEEEVLNVPRSVTVISREQIQEQAAANRNVIDILANTVPGFGAPSNRSNSFGQTLRGREISVLIDGVPQNSNFNPLFTELTNIDPSAIERIEVIRGTNAIFGGKATGGTVNIITRQAGEDRLSSEIEAGGNISLTNLEDSFGGFLKYGISGKEGKFDYATSLSIERTGGYFDAEGDRISQYAGPEDAFSLNGLAKFGVALDDNQRLQFTLNHFNQTRDTKFIPDPEIDNIEGVQKARAIPLPAGTQVIGVDDFSFTRNTIASLSYTNDNIFGSELQAQVYFRDSAFGGGFPQDGRDFFGFIFSSPGESQQFGTRVQINTPLSEDKLSLLWGVDYNRETSSQRLNIFDDAEFDASGGLIYRKIGDRTFTPEYKFSDLGLFAQLTWDVSDKFQLSGGLRHVRLGFDVEDYTTIGDVLVTGGDKNASDTVFNASLVYKPAEEVSLFANFSQGFSIPDIGQVLRRPPDGFINISDASSLTEPQKVDNYEIGIKGEWDKWQASLSAFYNYSALGADFELGEDGDLQTIRAPQRVYGIEAAVDVQPSPNWKLGGTLTWLEGENDPANDGNFVALNSITVPPLKLTGYLENQTTPGWRNRLQFLLSGSRDRAFNDEVDSAPIESFFTVDYISAIKLGNGELQLGVQNLFNSQYFPVYSQYFAPFFDSSNYAGRGRTLSVGYKLRW